MRRMRPFAIVDDVKEKLGVDACLMQYPMGAGETFVGMIDLIRQKFFKNGETVLFLHTGGQPALFADKYANEL